MSVLQAHLNWLVTVHVLHLSIQKYVGCDCRSSLILKQCNEGLKGMCISTIRLGNDHSSAVTILSFSSILLCGKVCTGPLDSPLFGPVQ